MVGPTQEEPVAQSQQTYANHARYFPLFHFFAFPILLINFVVSAWHVVRTPTLGALWSAVVAAALAAGILAARVMALAVQDRVIRLEMRLRLQECLPPDLRARINELTRQQLVCLRFAGTEELPALVRQVLAGSLKTNAEIKKSVKEWQPDNLRA
jgi:hypothetical protein